MFVLESGITTHDVPLHFRAENDSINFFQCHFSLLINLKLILKEIWLQNFNKIGNR